MKKNSESLKTFFENIESLKQREIIRSDRYLGDIGEFIIQKKYGLLLTQNKREQHIDGDMEGQSVQVKFNSSPTKTNIDIGNPNHYDILYLVLSKQSLHFPINIKSDFVIYSIPSLTILSHLTMSKKGKYAFTKKMLINYIPETINYDDLD